MLRRFIATAAALLLIASTVPAHAADTGRVAKASSSLSEFEAAGALDGDRFSAMEGSAWKGARGARNWWWEVRFTELREVGAILQIHGDHPTILRNAPKRYMWRWTADGSIWQNLPETETMAERRMFRVHRLKESVRARALRLMILEVEGELPTLREAEFYGSPTATISFPDWIISVSTGEEPTLSRSPFIKLARQCPGWERVPGQHLWMGNFDEAFAAAEPRPLCAFLSGNSVDWCEKMQTPWRGIDEVFRKRNLPIWAACGGAQGLVILQEVGLDRPWDCPRCRDPKSPVKPIYTHIGHKGLTVCGDYSKNIMEQGKFNMLQSARDPAFEGLSREFEIMESHCGQMAYVPKGWVQVVTRGRGAHTINQCLRVKDRYIYSAQFHIEMAGTPENSRRIMGNFLSLAKQWGGYNPKGSPVAEPVALPAEAPDSRGSQKSGDRR
jgi:hypothetical protein